MNDVEKCISAEELGRHAFAAYEVGGCAAARICDFPKGSQEWVDWHKGFDEQREEYEKDLGKK